eukprot:TRINITY_DN6602_c0_g1_i1.p1 TRINITY_DN6602_c0_g1~~TRINITY_DN6602_c0_g1_i1.p1  ORF type:complete len:478 (+),score=88.43 TRINITY_DN6602_c0_g1_i1:71-1504(+)
MSWDRESPSLQTDDHSHFRGLYQNGAPCTFSVTKQYLRWQCRGVDYTLIFSDVAGLITSHNWIILQCWVPFEGKERRKRLCEFHADDAELIASITQKIRNIIEPPISKGVPYLRYAVILNPFGGTGKGREIFHDIRPIFHAAGISLDVFETQRSKHGYEIVLEMDLDKYQALIGAGGDGTLYEIINALYHRFDWRTATKIPIGTIPAGSGNGLAASINFLDPIGAAMRLIRGNVVPLDVSVVRQAGSAPMFSFLSLSWGITGKVDIETESLRWMGDARFTYGAVKEIINLTSYKGNLHYLERKEPANIPCEVFSHCPNCAQVKENTDSLDASRAHQILENLAGRGKDYIIPEGSSVHNIDPEAEHEWTQIHDRFMFFMACNVRKINYDMIPAPFAHLSDGAIDLAFVKGKHSRVSLANMMLKLETGEQIQLPQFSYHKVHSFYLEPVDSSYLVVDGEIVPYRPLRYDVIPSALKLLV